MLKCPLLLTVRIKIWETIFKDMNTVKEMKLFLLLWGVEMVSVVGELLFLPWEHPPGGWTTHVRGRVMDYKVTCLSIALTSLREL